MMARSPDDEIERWMNRGLEYVRQPGVSGKDSVVSVMLARSGASPEYIDMAIDFVLSAEEPKQLRDSVLFHLARTCSFNVDNAMIYLASTAANVRKREVARALATGVRRYPSRLPKVIKALQNESTATVFAVLGQMIRLGSNAPELDDAILNALTLHAGEDGYHSFLRNLSPGVRPTFSPRTPPGSSQRWADTLSAKLRKSVAQSGIYNHDDSSAIGFPHPSRTGVVRV